MLCGNRSFRDRAAMDDIASSSAATPPRHIALYLPSLRGGGAERVMATLANGFAARGHRVDLVLAQAEGPYLADVSDQVRIVDLNRRRVLSSLWPLARYLRKERPDAMLSALNHANVIAILARKLARVTTRLVVSERNAPSRSLAGGGMNRAMRGLIRSFYPAADLVVCVSKGVMREMNDLLGVPVAKLTTIYNPLDVDRIRELMREPVSLPWSPDDGVPLIVAVGRLTRQKDYPTLLRAFALMRANRRARLAILGQGEEVENLRRLAEELNIGSDVALLGFQSNPFSWMHRADLYVMSSAWEGLPGTLLEAMACGTRIVSTNCRTGPDEILEDGRWGRLVPVGDSEALSFAMTEALDDQTPVDTLSRAASFRPELGIDSYLSRLI